MKRREILLMSNVDDKDTKILKPCEDKDSDMIFTVPNCISFFRILLIIPFVLFFISGSYIEAFSFILLSGISDCLDGLLARKLNQVSKLGKLLDPIADKLTLVAVVICFGILIPVIFPFVSVLVIKDVLMLAGGFYLLKKGIVPPAAKWYGKAATVIFYVSVVSIVLYKSVLHYDIPYLTVFLIGLTVFAMIFALLNYARVFLLLVKNLHNGTQEASEKLEC